MKRTTAYLAVPATVLALLLTGCGGQEITDSVGDAAGNTAFTMGFKTAFPHLAQGRSDAELQEIIDSTCADIAAKKPESEIRAGITKRFGNADGDAPLTESKAIYQTIAMAC